MEQQVDPRDAGIDWNAFRDSQREVAREAVGGALALDEVARRDAIQQAVIDRLLGIVARNAGELTEAQRARVEPDRLRVEVQQLREELRSERAQHAALRAMVSVRLVHRAKRVWDRVPFVRDAVKSLARRIA